MKNKIPTRFSCVGKCGGYTARGHKLRFSDKQGCLSDSAPGIFAGRYKSLNFAHVQYIYRERA